MNFVGLFPARLRFEPDRGDPCGRALLVAHGELHVEVVLVSKETRLGLHLDRAAREEKGLTKLVHDVQVEHDKVSDAL